MKIIITKMISVVRDGNLNPARRGPGPPCSNKSGFLRKLSPIEPELVLKNRSPMTFGLGMGIGSLGSAIPRIILEFHIYIYMLFFLFTHYLLFSLSVTSTDGLKPLSIRSLPSSSTSLVAISIITAGRRYTFLYQENQTLQVEMMRSMR